MNETTHYLLCWLCAAVGAAAMLAGCQTTRTLPDGTVVTEYDEQSTRAALDVALIALDVWERLEARDVQQSEADYQRELERRQQRVAELREALRLISQR